MRAPSENLALAEAGRLLSSWLGQPKPRIRLQDRPTGADLIVEQGRKLRLVVESKRSGDSAIVGAAIRQLSQYTKLLGGHAVPVVAVPYMGEVGKRLCAEAGVSWLDLSGNAGIVAPGLRVIIEGKPNLFPRRGRPSSAFAPKSARVARRLLIEPGRWFRQQELARETGLDDGFTSRIVHRLEEANLLERAKDGAVRVSDPNLLLDAWTEVYDFDKHTIVRGHVTTKDSEDLLPRLQKALDKGKLRHAATGLAAAWLYTQFAGFRLATFFVEKRPPESLLREVGFREEPKGANVWLVVPNDQGVFDGAKKQDGIDCVHPVQAYLDLQAHPERAQEGAAELRACLLRWKH